MNLYTLLQAESRIGVAEAVGRARYAVRAFTQASFIKYILDQMLVERFSRFAVDGAEIRSFDSVAFDTALMRSR